LILVAAVIALLGQDPGPGSSDEVLLERGTRLLLSGRTEGAAWIRHMKGPDAPRSLALALKQAGRTAEALSIYETLPRTEVDRGLCLQGIGRWSEAVAAFRSDAEGPWGALNIRWIGFHLPGALDGSAGRSAATPGWGRRLWTLERLFAPPRHD
jgi:hypothetical protein